MTQPNVSLLDLSDEILLIILKKLDNTDVLYSLLDVDNQRLNTLVHDKSFTNTINFVLTTITDDVLSIADSILDQFCISILPKIDYNIKSLVLESESMERILLSADYPNLTELTLYNVNDHIVSHHFTVESPFRRIFQEQIADLILRFNDCIALLDGHLKQLNTFIVNINYTSDDLSNVYNMDDLPDMKCFSLTCCCETNEYDTRVLPLLRRMIKLEELTLDITNDERTSFIDGTQINDEILVHMPCLRKFIFHIRTKVELRHLTHYASNEDIQRTFTNIGYQQVCCVLNYIVGNVICHIFSLPFAFDYLGYIGNIFPPIDFSRVKELDVHDKIPFEHEYFIRIARFFPLLKELSVINFESQSQTRDNLVSNNDELYPTVEYPNLISLSFQCSHVDYVEQFLNERKTHLPHLTKLMVDYKKLRIVTKNFTRNATRRNCAQVKQLTIDKTIVHTKEFYNYFPLLLFCFCYD
ncbi:unnamed protein product [Rotaria magnacalcarata]